MEIEKKILEEYNLVCKVYENYFEFENYLTDEIRNLISNKKTIHILEIGTGTGITTDIILNSRNYIKLITVDKSLNAIKISKKKFKNKTNVEFIHMDILEFLRKTTISFDIIVSAFTIHNFNKNYRNYVYQKIYDRMNSNSIFLNADKYSPDDDEIRINSLNNILEKYSTVFIENKQELLLEEWHAHYIDDQSNRKILKANESIKVMKYYGYKDISILHRDNSKMLAILKARK